MPTINPERLLETLQTLRTFGATASGVVRPSFSAADMAARHWLCEQMTAAGLDARIDGVGNVIGCSRQRSKALLVGSHSDTQPRGGGWTVRWALATASKLSAPLPRTRSPIFTRGRSGLGR